MRADDRFLLHRTAIEPLLPDTHVDSLDVAAKTIIDVGEESFLRFLQNHRLSPMWHKAILDQSKTSLFSQGFLAVLRRERIASAALYLAQQNAVLEIQNTFDQASISSAVFKGAHLRELVYTEPSLRTACDVDVLVARADRVKAIKLLVACGYDLVQKPISISHEVSLNKGMVSIDLHWDILRPGRTKTPMTDEIISTSKCYESYSGTNDVMTVFLMLVHPTITKYCNGRDSPIVLLLDLALWIDQRSIEWLALQKLLDRSGLKTAAWAMSQWLQLITRVKFPDQFIKFVQPGGIRARYLQKWISDNYSTRLEKYPSMLATGFTLPCHDNPVDALKFVHSAVQARRHGKHQIINTPRRTSS